MAAQTVTDPDLTVLILSTTLSHSQLLLKKCLLAWSKMAPSIKIVRATQTALDLENGSQIVCVPAGQDGNSARGHGVKNDGILVYDEDAFLANAVYDATLPIRKDGGRIPIIPTPGRKGDMPVNQKGTARWREPAGAVNQNGALPSLASQGTGTPGSRVNASSRACSPHAGVPSREAGRGCASGAEFCFRIDILFHAPRLLDLRCRTSK